jgi:hypothetical protein
VNCPFILVKFAGAVSPGVPATFLGNYKRAVIFLEDLEQQCTTQAGLSAFRACQAYTSFLKRWKLSIYFSTRFQVLKSNCLFAHHRG